jgi:CRP-like cAMP-binding protein
VVARVRVGGASSSRLDELVQRFPAGSVIFKEGDLGSEMFIIQNGQVRISRVIGEQERELAVLEKGDFFGEMALLEELPERSASVTAITDVEVLQLRSADFDNILRRKPEIAVRMMMKLSERLREANRRYDELAGKQDPAMVMRPSPASQGIKVNAALFHENSGALFVLHNEGDTSIGRHDPVTGVTPDIDLTDMDTERTVSRRHATIHTADKTLTVTETNASTNGTFVNGDRLDPFAPRTIVDGDVVQLALVPLRLHIFSHDG